MKNRLITQLFLLIPLIAFCQIDTTSLNSLNVKCKVSKITEHTFSAKDSIGKVIKGIFLYEDYMFKIDSTYYKNKTNFEYQFDLNGKQISKGLYNMYGYLYNITKYTYINNQITEFNEIIEFSDGIIHIKNLCKYDMNNLISIATYRNNELLYKVLFKYDDSNNIIEETSIDYNGNITSKINRKYFGKKLIYELETNKNYNNEAIYRYDTLGNIVYSMNRYDDITFENRIEYIDNLPVLECSSRNGEPELIVNYKYLDGKNTKTVLKNPSDNSIISSSEVIYYSNNTSEIVEKRGNQLMKHFFDTNNNIIKLQISNNSTDIEEYTYEYTYDKNKNWIRIIEYRNTIPLKIRERIIEYFI